MDTNLAISRMEKAFSKRVEGAVNAATKAMKVVRKILPQKLWEDLDFDQKEMDEGDNMNQDETEKCIQLASVVDTCCTQR